MEPSPRLSDREWEVVNQLRLGKSNKLIASSLHISERTVEFHLDNIYDKFQVNSRVELILKLGESTVANQTPDAENRYVPDGGHWAEPMREAVSRIGKELKLTDQINSISREEGNVNPFFTAIRVCFTKYASFDGRAARPEFWWFALFVILVVAGLSYLHETLARVFLLAVLLPLLAAGARRLHDIGKSGWWQLFLLVPVGGLVILGVLWAQPTSGSLPEESPAP